MGMCIGSASAQRNRKLEISTKCLNPLSPQAPQPSVVGCETESGQPRVGAQEAVGGGGPQKEMNPSGEQMAP